MPTTEGAARVRAAGPAEPAAPRAVNRRTPGRAPVIAVLTQLAIWVPLGLTALQVVGFTIWTTWVSFTPSTLLPESGFVGLRNYVRVMRTPNLQIAYVNLVIFGVGFVLLTSALGLLLAVLLDQRVRGENVLRTIFLYPLAVSFVVTGTVWSWLLNPGIGIQRLVNNFGWTGFRFDWIVQPDRAIYTLIIAGAWQGAGFAMALFLAGLRSVDSDLVKAAQIDGAGPWRMYRRVLLPTIWPIFITVAAILLQFAIKTFDLVRALTEGGPGISTMLPAVVVYDFMFQRSELGRGAAVAVLMLLTLVVVVAPFGIYLRLRARRQARA
ncbi:MAG TPA: sugar ABC transporter permease [Acetobacteraceae bacterium]|jgi:glucose/mannose transport system permease protein|nr:sugar ABC transporter permease [Acetobacteraceae bacterium]